MISDFVHPRPRPQRRYTSFDSEDANDDEEGLSRAGHCACQNPVGAEADPTFDYEFSSSKPEWWALNL